MRVKQHEVPSPSPHPDLEPDPASPRRTPIHLVQTPWLAHTLHSHPLARPHTSSTPLGSPIQAIIADGMLDAATTVMAIWPAPMIYGGPTEVHFSALFFTFLKLFRIFWPVFSAHYLPTLTHRFFPPPTTHRVQVLFHAKSRRNAGATYFVAGRDPAGMKGSSLAQAHPDDDLYDGNHGR